MVDMNQSMEKGKRKMFWDNAYKNNKRLWGDKPGELAIAVVRYLRNRGFDNLSILDIGCGYGRDAFYFSDNIRCRVLGIDISEKAVEMATQAAFKAQKKDIRFQRHSFTELKKEKYDVIFISNLYQLLKKNERAALRKKVMGMVKPGGLLFLSTLSTSDPEHYRKGIPVNDESNSFQDAVHLHFCTGEELREDFAFLDIEELYEHEYHEPHATGETHHHISWIMIGKYAGK